MTQPPSWWESLVADPVTQRFGIDWRDPSDFKPVTDESWTGTMSNELLDSLDARARDSKVLIASGPSIKRRGTTEPSTVHWYLDPAEPQQLWCALDECYAAWLWIPVAPTAEAIADALEQSHPSPQLNRQQLTKFNRGFLGFAHEVAIPQIHSGDMVAFNGPDLDRYVTGIQYLEFGSWASSRLDDPLQADVDYESPQAVLTAANQRNIQAQLLGRIPSKTWRTLHSRSYLSFEVHTRDVVCVSVRYRPSPSSHHSVVAALNSEYDSHFPADLPLDVVGALAGFQYAREHHLIHNLTQPEHSQQLSAAIRIFAALWSGDLQQTFQLREFCKHEDPDVRLALARVASWYGYRFLLEEIALAETAPDTIASLESLIIQGSKADVFNAFADDFEDRPVIVDRNGEHVETWGHSDDEVPDEDDIDDGDQDWDEDAERNK